MASANAQARLEMAKEKARMAGRKPALPSRLERAAEEWKQQREQQEGLRSQGGPETSAVTLQRVPLKARAEAKATYGEIGWRPHRRGDEDKPRQVMLNAAMISRIAQRLKANEWARAMGKTRARPSSSSLEKWAEAWRRDRQQQERAAAPC